MPKSAITRLSSLDITPSASKNNGFYAPQLTAAQIGAIPAATLRNGALVYNITVNFFQVYQNGAWNTLNSSLTNATGVGLTTGSPFTLPAGTRAAVEVAGNQVQGFMYYDTTNNVYRARTNAAWLTVTIA